jgi:hypothetical protein
MIAEKAIKCEACGETIEKGEEFYKGFFSEFGVLCEFCCEDIEGGF